MDIVKAKQLAHKIQAHHTLYGWQIQFVPTLGKATSDKEAVIAGDCDLHTKVIRMSEAVAKNSTEDEFLQDLLHEIAHALNGSPEHNSEWRKVGIEIGYKPKDGLYDFGFYDENREKWRFGQLAREQRESKRLMRETKVLPVVITEKMIKGFHKENTKMLNPKTKKKILTFVFIGVGIIVLGAFAGKIAQNIYKR